MGQEMPEGLDKSIDPKKLIVQDGVNQGRIADQELARIGALGEHKARERLDDLNSAGMIEVGFSPKDIAQKSDEMGAISMSGEVRKRAMAAAGDSSQAVRQEVGKAAYEDFSAEVDAQAEAKKAADVSKAEEILGRLKQ